MSAAVATAAALACAVAAAPARAAGDPCHDPFSSVPPEHPLSGQLRWDAAVSGMELSNGWRFVGGASLGMTEIVERMYQSFDLGAFLTVGATTGDVRAVIVAAELGGRFYPVKLRQATGIDSCGQGTKTRRWSESTNGAGYVGARAGYGHIGGDVPGHHGLLLTPGFGYDFNLGEGRATSLFAQASWRFDLLPGDGAPRIGGPAVELGLRF